MYKVLGSKSITLDKRVKQISLPSETGLINAIYNLLTSVRDSVPLGQLADSLSQTDPTQTLNLINIEHRLSEAAQGKGVQAAESSMWDVLHRTYTQGAQQGLNALTRIKVRKSVATDLRFDMLNPQAIEFLQRYRFELIADISAGSREAIRDIMLSAFEEGGSPREQARQIRQVVGLTVQQAQAVKNFRAALMSGDPSKMQDALERALRDKRFDRTVLRSIENSAKIPKDQVDRMVSRYVDRSLMARATAIARTETIRASRMGQQETWRQAVDQELLDPDKNRQQWLVGPDACDDCQQVADDNNDEGVPIDGTFDTPDGPIDGPPLHTHCKCGVGLMEA